MMKFIRFVYSFKMTIAWILALLAVVVIGALFQGAELYVHGHRGSYGNGRERAEFRECESKSM